MSRLRAIDPAGCDCTQCQTGEHRPLNLATAADIGALLTGPQSLRDRTGTRFTIETRYDNRVAGELFGAPLTHLRVRCGELNWTLDSRTARVLTNYLAQ